MTSLVKQVTWLFAIVFILLGVAGFFSNGMLLVFEVDTVHNIIHLLSGIAALLAVSAGESYARLYLIVFGIVYGLVTVLGFITTDGMILGLFHVNDADNYLHAAITLVTLGVGLGTRKK